MPFIREKNSYRKHTYFVSVYSYPGPKARMPLMMTAEHCFSLKLLH